MGAPVGNNNASKGRTWEETLRRAVLQDDGQRLRLAAEMLLTKASEGDLNAIKELADRLDGKAKQSIDHKMDSTVNVSVPPAVSELIQRISEIAGTGTTGDSATPS